MLNATLAASSVEPRPRRPDVERALRADPVVWLSSVQSDGRPHVVPVWFWWDGTAILAFSKPHARKVANLRNQPRVMLAVGTPGPKYEVELIEAEAELPTVASAALMPDAFAHKYRDLLDQAGLSAERFVEVYAQPIVMRPRRFLGYGGSTGASVSPAA